MQFFNNRNSNEPNNPEKKPNPTPPGSPQLPRWVWPTILIMLLAWLVLQLPGMFDGFAGNPVTVSMSFFLGQVDAGNVDEVVIEGSTVTGMLNNAETYTDDTGRQQDVSAFSVTLPDNYASLGDLIPRLESNNVQFSVRSTEISPFLAILINFAPLLLLIVFFVWMARRTQNQMTGVFGFGQSQAREHNVERPQVTFDDVAGQDAAKQELEEVVDFLKEPEKYIALGARVPRGVLLIGPPGTGKTLLARAVAGEAKVSFFSIAASEFVEMFVGVGASRVRDLFRRAKQNAPSIVFIDEIDAVGRQRGAGLGGGHDEREQTLNQMLSEMDGFEQTESVIIMAATNRPDVLDPALLRPGRFDRQVTVGLPDRKGRVAILKIHARGKPLGPDVDLDQLAGGTIGFSGADLANLCNEAALTAARKNHKRISGRDFSDAFDRIVLGTESPPLSNEQERRVVAYHEAGHAMVAALTPGADPVLKVTIVPRGQALGVTAQIPTEDIRNYSRQYLLGRMKVLLGGRAAEKVVFEDVTTGASNDLQRVTDLARRMVMQFGMSERIGPLNFGEDETQPFLGYALSHTRHYSEETAAKIDEEVKALVEALYTETLELLRANRDKLDALANELLTDEVVEAQRVFEIAGLDSSANGNLKHFALRDGGNLPDMKPAPQPAPVSPGSEDHDTN